MLLLYLLAVRSFYLWHENTGSFVGSDDIGDNDQRVRIVEDPSKAIDWKMIRIRRTGPLGFFMQANNGMVMDVRGKPDGREIGFFQPHGRPNQSFKLVFVADNYFVLMLGELCVAWDAESRVFKKGECGNPIKDTAKFKILDETTPKEPEEPRYVTKAPVYRAYRTMVRRNGAGILSAEDELDEVTDQPHHILKEGIPLEFSFAEPTEEIQYDTADLQVGSGDGMPGKIVIGEGKIGRAHV